MRPTILLVDDSNAIHELLRAEFAEEPYDFCSAYTGSDGIAMASSQATDLVLLDLDLPDINGFDVCRHIRASPATCRTAVIFLTSSASSDEKVCGLQLHAVDYVTKPFDGAELRLRVRAALHTKRLFDLLQRGRRPGISGNAWHTSEVIQATQSS